MQRLAWLAYLLADVAAVLVFCAVGRRSHAEGITIAGVATTAWPFLTGTVVGWLAARGWSAGRARPIFGQGTDFLDLFWENLFLEILFLEVLGPGSTPRATSSPTIGRRFSNHTARAA